MNEGLIPKRYAKALYKYACEKGADLGLYRLMGTLGRSFADYPTLEQTIGNPFVGDNEKISLLMAAANLAPAQKPADTAAPKADVKAQKPAASEVEASAYADFLKLLRQNQRLAMAGSIARAYCDIYRKENRIYRVRIVSAQPLEAAEQKRLEQLIESHLHGGKSEFSFATDSELIGGFTVDIDNERLDASVKNELKQLRLKLLKQA
jgi:F-type H+-transporting ATPase subunit delta